jgi:hypothetical protein
MTSFRQGDLSGTFLKWRCDDKPRYCQGGDTTTTLVLGEGTRERRQTSWEGEVAHAIGWPDRQRATRGQQW